MSRGRNNKQSSPDLMECHLYTTTSIKTKDHLHFKKRQWQKKFNAKTTFFLQYYGKKCRKRTEYISKLESESATPSRPQLRDCWATDSPLAGQFHSRPLHAPVFFGSPRPLPLVPPSRNTSWKRERILGFIVIILFVFVRTSSPFSGPQGRLAWNSKGFSAAAIASEAPARPLAFFR